MRSCGFVCFVITLAHSAQSDKTLNFHRNNARSRSIKTSSFVWPPYAYMWQLISHVTQTDAHTGHGPRLTAHDKFIIVSVCICVSSVVQCSLLINFLSRVAFGEWHAVAYKTYRHQFITTGVVSVYTISSRANSIQPHLAHKAQQYHLRFHNFYINTVVKKSAVQKNANKNVNGKDFQLVNE